MAQGSQRNKGAANKEADPQTKSATGYVEKKTDKEQEKVNDKEKGCKKDDLGTKEHSAQPLGHGMKYSNGESTNDHTQETDERKAKKQKTQERHNYTESPQVEGHPQNVFSISIGVHNNIYIYATPQTPTGNRNGKQSTHNGKFAEDLWEKPRRKATKRHQWHETIGWNNWQEEEAGKHQDKEYKPSSNEDTTMEWCATQRGKHHSNEAEKNNYKETILEETARTVEGIKGSAAQDPNTKERNGQPDVDKPQGSKSYE